MKTPSFKLLLAVVALTGAATSEAYAQPQPQGSRPGYSPNSGARVSPYLLLRGRNPAISYYGIVRPQQALGQGIQQLQQQQSLDEQTLESVAAGEALPVTGHPAFFMNYSHYYPGMSPQTAPTRRPAGALPARTSTTRGISPR